MDIVRAAEQVAQRETALLHRLRALVELESPSEDAAAVNQAGELVAGWAGELGGTVLRHPGDSFGDVFELRFGHRAGAGGALGNDLGKDLEKELGQTQRGVLLLGHLDTVWPVGTLASMAWQHEDGRLWGPGVLDMKAGIVMALEAIAAVRAVAGGLPRPVTLLLNPDEEVGSPVSRAHTERLARTVEAVFVLEPAQGLAYKTARKGVGHFTLSIQGVAAHAGVDFGRGHSAIREAARLIEEVSAWTDLARGRTVNVGVIHGGTRSNVIASECEVEVDVRIVTMADAAEIETLFAGLRAHDPGCTLTVRGGLNRPPMERGDGTVALFRQAQRLAAGLGFQLEEAATGGGSDGNFTAALGVPTLDGMGAIGTGAHAAHEHVVQASLGERTALLAGMIAGWDA